jgi:hypothetical protein
LTYFFDENISFRHANMLRALGEQVVHISKARGFRRADPDTVWMPKVAEEGWTATTLDVAILRIVVERYVPAKSGLRVVFLAEGFRNKPFFEQAKFLVNHWEALKKGTERGKPGDCFRVTVRGRLEPMVFKGN